MCADAETSAFQEAQGERLSICVHLSNAGAKGLAARAKCAKMRNMLRYALFTLPGPGDAILAATAERGLSPTLLVHAEPGDFSSSAVRRLVYDAPHFMATLHENGIEAILVAGWDCKIPVADYAWLKYGAWNVHPSLLPRYRGFNPYFWVIANGEAETGITVHGLTDRFDAGPILLQRRVALRPDETLASLWQRLSAEGAAAVCEALPLIANGTPPLTAQDPGEWPRAPRVTPAMLLLDSRRTKEENARLVRAANPFYGAVWRDGERLVKVFAVADAGEGPLVLCRDGHLVASVVQTEERGLMTGAQYCRLGLR